MSDPSAAADKSDSPTSAAPKRSATDAGLPSNGTRPHKSVKRRASKACQCCRARKVRCNVVEQTPCTNCRLDEVECIVSESKRKKFVPYLSVLRDQTTYVVFLQEVDKIRRGNHMHRTSRGICQERLCDFGISIEFLRTNRD